MAGVPAGKAAWKAMQPQAAELVVSRWILSVGGDLPNSPRPGTSVPMQLRQRRFPGPWWGAGAGGGFRLVGAAVVFFSDGPDPVWQGIRLSEILRNERLWGLHLVALDRTAPLSFTNLFDPREQEYIRALHGMNE